MKSRILLALFGFFAIAWYGWNLADLSQENSSEPAGLGLRLSQLAPPAEKARRPVRAKRAPATGTAVTSWDEFKARHGAGLEAIFTADGRLAQVRGAPRGGSGSGAGFNPRDAAQAQARAREIVEDAARLLRLRAEFPLGEGRAQPGALSAQVYFTQSSEGAAFTPTGQVTVDLGPDGELLGLYSDYASDVAISNTVQVDAEAAARSAEAQGAGAGRAIIWVSGSEGRHAYEFSVQGRQVVVDAQTGAVIFRRDRRIF